MKTGLLLDDIFTGHDPGENHPEAPGRIKAIREQLEKSELISQCDAIPLRAVTDDEVRLAHTNGYLKTVITEIDGTSSGTLSTGDTNFGKRSLNVARNAAGGLLNAVDSVVKRETKNAFCAVRPPGHHATADRGMGFCIFNSAAIAARYAKAKYGMERVAIIDWDVHHGNGTQDIFIEDPDVFYFSTHQHPWYPGTGKISETGTGRGKHTNLNAPLPAGTDMAAIAKAFQSDFVPKMKDYKPDLVIISAGFDSREKDPLGDFLLSDDDFSDLTKILLEIAGEFSESRLVSVLEGGYNKKGLARAVDAHLSALIASEI
ncbi:histone deacetylase [Verrucomicrobiales bacterium]|nr:histone deacetylase [Verrucomicrobiales bacterium]